MLRSFSGTEIPKLKFLTPTFASSFERVVTANPDKIAIVWLANDGRRIEKTFADFAADTAAVRALLKTKSKANTVATAAGNTYAHLVYIVAALLEKKTLCPLNPDEGDRRIREKIAQLGEPTDFFASPTLSTNTSTNAASTAIDPSPFPSTRPMVLIFTSGSTGYSKIVEQTELGILANVDALIERHKLSLPTVIGTPLPVFHVNALEFSFFCSLLSGNKFVLFESFQLQRVLSAIQEEKIDILSLVPHLIRVLKERATPADLARLRYVVSAAAPLDTATASDFPVRILQGYGLSEAVNFSALMPSELGETEFGRWIKGRPSIGTELRGNSIHILDSDGRELDENQTGELCIRGWNVMRGYRGDTKQDAFANDALHTGDLGHFARDLQGRKFFFVSGRIKDVIKRNASTISLAEADATLTSIHPNIITVGFTHATAGEELAAIVQSENYDAAALEKLRKEIEKRCPPTLRPHVLAVTKDSVRTASGKPQRWKFKKSLEKWSDKVFGDSVFVAPEEICSETK